MLSRVSQFVAKRTLFQSATVFRPAGFAFFSSAEVVPGIGKGKTSTGIVGIPVDPHAVSNIVVHYQSLLDRMAASDMPETAQYRVDIEKIARHRIKVAMENPEDPDMVEEMCQCGQVEELVEQAKDEMTVLDMYLKERLWEQIDASDVDVEYNPDPSMDHEGIDEEQSS